MKKLAVLLAVVSVAVLAAPALSATNPFMDVPMGHWAYDAISELYANDIMRGYEDGLFKGNRTATRYEMANAIARALQVVDWSKATKHEVDVLKELLLEFKKELDNLGVSVDERFGAWEERLGGWHIHGTLVLDIMNQSAKNATEREGDGSIKFDEARLFFERTWGDEDEYFFRARLRNEGNDHNGNAGGSDGSAYMDRFYVEMPFFFDSRLTVGRFSWNWEGAYKIDLPETGGWNGDTILTDWAWTGLGLTKNFALGSVSAVFAHPDKNMEGFDVYNAITAPNGIHASDWMIMLGTSLQFNEKIGFDLGAQAFIGDNAETPIAPHANGDLSFNNLWTIFAGLRFNFTDDIALRGVFYHQKIDAERANTAIPAWEDYGYGVHEHGDPTLALLDTDDANHWAAIIDVKQDALKYTSLWLEYGQYDQGFITRSGSSIFYSGSDVMFGRQAPVDTKYYRIGLGQDWSKIFEGSKWKSYLFYYGYVLDNYHQNATTGNWENIKPAEYGVGVSYQLNDYTTMGLNYIHVDSKEGTDDDKDNVIRFRTAISF
ncbi:MAG: S-layer homology domain-containing protein [Synergistaceae bacterium]|nr:S-layer homology domain-containing protein [Synergistaceae bacterium]